MTIAKKTIFTVIFAITSIITVPAFFKAIIHMFTHMYMYWWFLAGWVLYVIVAVLVFPQNIELLQTLSHECLHLDACLIMLKKVDLMKVTSGNGGFITHEGKSNMFIKLAPYTIPAITIVLVLIQTMIPAKYIAFGIVVGFSFFFYIHSFAVQTRLYQDDINNKEYGALLSILYIITLLSFNLSICILAIDMKFFKAVAFYFSDIWNTAVGLFSAIF